MRLNTLSPAEGAKKSARRLGRGIGSGRGKTCGHGHKGQLARAGGNVRPGFEGGQTPMYRRLPKQGFTCLKSRFHQELRLSELAVFSPDQVITLDLLKMAGMVKGFIRSVKIFVDRPIEGTRQVHGLPSSSGAKAYLIEVASAE